MVLAAEATSISPAIALVSTSLIVWALDLLPSIVGLFGFAVLLNLATSSVEEKVKYRLLRARKDLKFNQLEGP